MKLTTKKWRTILLNTKSANALVVRLYFEKIPFRRYLWEFRSIGFVNLTSQTRCY